MTEEKAKTLERVATAALLRLWLSDSYGPGGSGVFNNHTSAALLCRCSDWPPAPCKANIYKFFRCLLSFPKTKSTAVSSIVPYIEYSVINYLTYTFFFQYSDILSYLQDNKMLLFYDLVFFFVSSLERSLRMNADSFYHDGFECFCLKLDT